MTNTARTATEQLLTSSAMEAAIGKIDYQPLAGGFVYLDTTYFDPLVDRKYAIGCLREALLLAGVHLTQERTFADTILEARVAAAGTNERSCIIPLPSVTLATLVSGIPSITSTSPGKLTRQQAIAKLALFAYDAQTDVVFWQSGNIEACTRTRHHSKP